MGTYNIHFKRKIEEILNAMGIPNDPLERVVDTKLLFDIERSEASKILQGFVPSGEVLEKIAKTLEIKKETLLASESTPKKK